MKAEEIHSIDFTHVKMATPLDRPSYEPTRPAPQRHSDIVTTPPLDHIRFNKLETNNTHSQDVAKQIREVHETMKEVDGHLQQMQSHLYGIVKMYPPYPPDSSERVEALRQFSGLRNMIDRLAAPAGPDDMRKIMGDPSRTPQSGDWHMSDEGQSQQLMIHHQPIHSGRGGLDLPAPGDVGSDAQLTDLINHTISARETLQNRHRSFVADANRIIVQIS